MATASEAVKVGCTYRFAYPAAFTTLPDYTAHAGQHVVVLRELQDGVDYDFEGDRLYLVRAADGWQGHAFCSELEG